LGVRVNAPGEVDDQLRRAADVGAVCVTLHAGWGMESDDEMDAMADAIANASARHNVPAYVETHRATMSQDIWRTCRWIDRRPGLRFNGDFSHYYCGQEMGYRGFATTRDYLDPILRRTSFMHGRVSDGQCMQCDLADPASDSHVENFRWLVADGDAALAGVGVARRRAAVHARARPAVERVLAHPPPRRGRAPRGTRRPLAAIPSYCGKSRSRNSPARPPRRRLCSHKVYHDCELAVVIGRACGSRPSSSRAFIREAFGGIPSAACRPSV
jgi:hypothetical protein